MAEIGIRMRLYIDLHLIPIALVVPDLFAEGANGNDTLAVVAAVGVFDLRERRRS